MISGEIYYGDINVSLELKRIQRNTGKVIETLKHTHRINRMVFTMHEGKIIQKLEYTNSRIQKKIPDHLKKYDIINIDYVGGIKVGDTVYDVSPFI